MQATDDANQGTTTMIWLYTACAISTLTLVAHVIGGGQSIAKPVLESDLEAEPKYASYYCWHMVTIVIAFMACAFLLSALSIASLDLAIAATMLALLFAIWSIALTVWKKQKNHYTTSVDIVSTDCNYWLPGRCSIVLG